MAEILENTAKPNILHRLGNVYDAIRGKSSQSISTQNANIFNSTFTDWFNLGSNQKNVSWIYDCVDVWGKHFAKVEFKLYDKGTYKTDEVEEVKKHPILDIFAKPNDFQTWWEIKYRMAQHFSFYGNWYLYKVRDAMGVPRQVIQLRPDRVYAYGSSTEFVSYYHYYTGTGMVRIEPKDIIVCRYPDVDNEVKGKAIISNILDVSDVDRMQLAYSKKFYQKGGFLGQVFTTKEKMSATDFSRAKAELQANYGGVDQSFNVALFDNDLQPIKSAYSIKDADITLSRANTRDEVCACWQVNKFMLGLAENINRATAQEVSKQFADGVIEPLMDYIDQVLTTQLCHVDFDSSYFIKHENTSPRDLDGDLAYYSSGIKNGWLAPKEVREFEDLPTIENTPYMDVPYDLSKTKLGSDNSNAGNGDATAK